MKPEQSRQLQEFYRALDDAALDELSPKCKVSIEKAILSIHAPEKHKVDFKASFPFFFKRYYLVLLFGQDQRLIARKESPFRILFFTLLILMILSVSFLSIVFALYITKSALGIDIFKHFSFGVWDWFKDLVGIYP